MSIPQIVVVGHATATSARLLVVGSTEDEVARLAYRDTSGKVLSVDISLQEAAPYRRGAFQLETLAPASTVTYAVDTARNAKELASPHALLDSPLTRTFRLLPASRPLRIALVSCNGTHTTPGPNRYAMWAELKRQIDQGNVDLIVHAGDQIYADPIKARMDSELQALTGSPDPATMEKLVAEYRSWYVRTWAAKEIRDVLTSCPSVMMWDDHDIYDGWGSNDEDQSPSGRAFFRAAQQAFSEFQAVNNPAPLGKNSFSFGFHHNHVGMLVLDARTHRDYSRGAIIGGEEQWQAIDRFLDSARPLGLRHLFVVVGVPPIHVDVATLLGLLERTPCQEEFTDDLRDAWVSQNNRNEASRLLMRLFQFAADSKTQVTLLSGDVHVASLGKIESSLPKHQSGTFGPAQLFQVVSSGIGHKAPTGIAGWLLRRVAKGTVRVTSDIQGELLPIMGADDHRVLSARNFAILKMADASGKTWDPNGNLWVEFYAEGYPRMLEQVLRRA